MNFGDEDLFKRPEFHAGELEIQDIASHEKVSMGLSYYSQSQHWLNSQAGGASLPIKQMGLTTR
ncbi:MAG: hypothetical protein MZU97_18620 [Bacillus subtilis]|nr:hypothetical protein [Bacillus subtilis]